MKTDSQLDVPKAPVVGPFSTSVEIRLMPPYLAVGGGGRIYLEIPEANFPGEGRVGLKLIPIDPQDSTWNGVLLEIVQHWPGLIECNWLNTNTHPVHPRPIRARLQVYEKEIVQ